MVHVCAGLGQLVKLPRLFFSRTADGVLRAAERDVAAGLDLALRGLRIDVDAERRAGVFGESERGQRNHEHDRDDEAGGGRRQDAPRCFDMNASIYVWRVASFLEHPAVFYPDTRLFEMPEERSVDIDSDLDFALVELLLRKRQAP